MDDLLPRVRKLMEHPEPRGSQGAGLLTIYNDLSVMKNIFKTYIVYSAVRVAESRGVVPTPSSFERARLSRVPKHPVARDEQRPAT